VGSGHGSYSVTPWAMLGALCEDDDRSRRASSLLVVATGCFIAVVAALAGLTALSYFAFGWLPVAGTGSGAIVLGIAHRACVTRRRREAASTERAGGGAAGLDEHG